MSTKPLELAWARQDQNSQTTSVRTVLVCNRNRTALAMNFLMSLLDHGPAELMRANRCQCGTIHALVGGLQNAMALSMFAAALCGASHGEILAWSPVAF